MAGRLPKYRVSLTSEQRAHLLARVQGGTHKSRTVRRAHTLLLSDESELSNTAIAQHLKTTPKTISRTQRRFVEEGLEAALTEKDRPGRPNVWLQRDDAQLTQIACTTPPGGRAKWTVRLLRDRFVELSETHDTISHERIRQSLKKTALNPGRTNGG